MSAPEAVSPHQQFWADVLSNRNNATIIERWDALSLPDGWLVAGFLFQAVWNLRSHRPAENQNQEYKNLLF